MNVKGFLMEDDQGQEYVMVCEPPDGQPGRIFTLRGWQRRRMVPLQCTKQELGHITEEVLIALNDLFQSPQDVWLSHSGIDQVQVRDLS